MGAVRRLRTQAVEEDADDGTVLSTWDIVPLDDIPEHDALAHAVRPESTWPMWWCDECDTRNEGRRWTCGMCGTVRDDADTLC